jgi:mannosyltransferase OCH1-like enzyme
MSNLKNFLYTSGKDYRLKKEEIDNKLRIPYPLKSNYNIKIPTNIFQTWHSKTLPPLMAKSVAKIIKLNPRFNYHLYDDNDCREFIKNNFKPDVLYAYDHLIPGAYKADLWRLCILFINGGIYMDIKLTCVNGFKLIELTEKEHFVQDRQQNGIFNTMIASPKGNVFLYKAIRKIVKNVQNKYYGEGPLSPTGPDLLYKVMINNQYKVNIDMFHYQEGGYIIYKNTFVISTEYDGYNEERTNQYNNINTKRYDVLWNERKVYK